jgi:beta-N-acetylhexosaminidase
LDRLRAAPQLDTATLASRAHLSQIQLAQGAPARRQRVLEAAVDWYITHLSLDDQLGQMLLAAFNDTSYAPDLATMVEQEHVGGIQLFGYNFSAPAHTQAMLQQAQAHARLPLFVTTDQEGGSVNRILPYFGAFPSAWELGQSGDTSVAANTGRRTALDLQQFGINADLAPVIDVPVDGGWIWSEQRVFSTDPQVVARYAGAFLDGLQSTNMIGCLKHFPGLGSVTTDPHTSLPVITRSLAQLRQTELAPYAVLIPQRPAMVMATDVVLRVVDPDYPAELSSAVIDGLLRQQLGYDGVVVTDALWMQGISERWSEGEAAVLAVLAGDDLLMAAYDATTMAIVRHALQTAVASGRITRARVVESVRRILLLKLEYGLLSIPHSILAQSPLVDP